jgi:phage/plasmid-associated DNA primase
MIKEVNKSFKYRIYPDDEQEKFFNQSIGNSRFVFNNIKNNYDYLGFSNGAYNIITREFKKISDNPILPYLSLQHKYDFNATETQVFENYIETSSYLDLNDLKRKIDIKKGFYQSIGLILTAKNPFKLFFLILGVIDSGKGVFVALLKHILGIWNTMPLYMEDLGTLEESDAYGKYAIFFNEVNPEKGFYEKKNRT